MVDYLSRHAPVKLFLTEDVYSFPFCWFLHGGHNKFQAVAIPAITAFLDCSVTVDCVLLRSITISLFSAAGM